MSDGWIVATLGEVAEIRGGGTPSTKDPGYWGGDVVWLTPTEVVKADGQRIRTSERTITSEGLEKSSAKVLPVGTVLLTTRASVGFVAIADVPLTTNQGFQSLIPRGEVTPEYLMYWIQGNRDEFASRAGGSTFLEISKSKVAGIPIAIPPVRVQRRIVDLMAHADYHLGNLRSERQALIAAFQALLYGWDSALADSPTVKLMTLCSPRSGPSWAAADESNAPASGSTRVVKITNTRPDGRLDMRDETYVVGVPDSALRLTERSLILIRTNGNRERIGNVYRPNAEAFGSVVSAFQFAAELESVEDRDWLYWWLKSPARQQAMSEAASGTTGLGNLAAGWLKELQVPWPSAEQRSRMLSPLEALERHQRALEREIAELEQLRRALLNNLLSGAVSVDEASYDAFLGLVA